MNEFISLSYDIIVLTRHLAELERTAAARGGIERSAIPVLLRISADGPLSIGELRDALGLDDSTLNRQTAAMIRAGVVERIDDPGGGVARKFRLTEDGADSLERAQAAYVAALAEALAATGESERLALGSALRMLDEGFERVKDRPWPRASAA